MAHTSTVSEKGQITLPKALRDKHHRTAGEVVLILDSENGIVVRHREPGPRGLLKDEMDGDALEADVRELRKEWNA
jgi:AbrB family looped-hinge helix DNA binding protein